MRYDSAMPGLRARVVNLCDDEIANSGLIATMRVFDPECGFSKISVQCARGGGGDGGWWDVSKSWAKGEGTFL